MRPDAPERVVIEDPAVLEPLMRRGLAAHARLRESGEALAAARRALDAAEFEAGQARREFEAVGREIAAAGYHDTGHIVGHLRKVQGERP